MEEGETQDVIEKLGNVFNTAPNFGDYVDIKKNTIRSR